MLPKSVMSTFLPTTIFALPPPPKPFTCAPYLFHPRFPRWFEKEIVKSLYFSRIYEDPRDPEDYAWDEEQDLRRKTLLSLCLTHKALLQLSQAGLYEDLVVKCHDPLQVNPLDGDGLRLTSFIRTEFGSRQNFPRPYRTQELVKTIRIVLIVPPSPHDCDAHVRRIVNVMSSEVTFPYTLSNILHIYRSKQPGYGLQRLELRFGYLAPFSCRAQQRLILSLPPLYTSSPSLPWSCITLNLQLAILNFLGTSLSFSGSGSHGVLMDWPTEYSTMSQYISVLRAIRSCDSRLRFPIQPRIADQPSRGEASLAKLKALPCHLFYQLFLYLPHVDLCNLMCTSRQMYQRVRGAVFKEIVIQCEEDCRKVYHLLDCSPQIADLVQVVSVVALPSLGLNGQSWVISDPTLPSLLSLFSDKLRNAKRLNLLAFPRSSTPIAHEKSPKICWSSFSKDFQKSFSSIFRSDGLFAGLTVNKRNSLESLSLHFPTNYPTQRPWTALCGGLAGFKELELTVPHIERASRTKKAKPDATLSSDRTIHLSQVRILGMHHRHSPANNSGKDTSKLGVTPFADLHLFSDIKRLDIQGLSLSVLDKLLDGCTLFLPGVIGPERILLPDLRLVFDVHEDLVPLSSNSRQRTFSHLNRFHLHFRCTQVVHLTGFFSPWVERYNLMMSMQHALLELVINLVFLPVPEDCGKVSGRRLDDEISMGHWKEWVNSLIHDHITVSLGLPRIVLDITLPKLEQGEDKNEWIDPHKLLREGLCDLIQYGSLAELSLRKWDGNLIWRTTKLNRMRKVEGYFEEREEQMKFPASWCDGTLLNI